jgi:hypothetical protein
LGGRRTELRSGDGQSVRLDMWERVVSYGIVREHVCRIKEHLHGIETGLWMAGAQLVEAWVEARRKARGKLGKRCGLDMRIYNWHQFTGPSTAALGSTVRVQHNAYSAYSATGGRGLCAPAAASGLRGSKQKQTMLGSCQVVEQRKAAATL